MPKEAEAQGGATGVSRCICDTLTLSRCEIFGSSFGGDPLRHALSRGAMLSQSHGCKGTWVVPLCDASEPMCRLDALRAQRLRSNPKEEQALMESARALTAAAKARIVEAPAVKSDVDGAESGPDQAAPANGKAEAGRGRGSSRGRGRGKASR